MQPLPGTCSSETESRGNACPHPCPLPEERGTRARSPGIFAPVGMALFHGASSENESRGNARPHPCPLPQERGKHGQFPGVFTPFGVALFRGNLRRRNFAFTLIELL